MANANHEPDELLITPPEKIFVMTRDRVHIARLDALDSKGCVYTLCGCYVMVASKSNQAYESEVCSKCISL